MMPMDAKPDLHAGGSSGPARPGAFVRRPWAVYLALGLIFLGAGLNLLYLWNHCPLALSEDEAHYWEWSRHLDYGYYSKPPGIAWIMWAAGAVGRWCGVAEVTMPVLRSAAVLFSVISGLASLGLARRIFRDDRAGLMVTVLAAAVPMFVVGALLLTIDSPMYMCWAVTVYALWRAVEGGLGGTQEQEAGSKKRAAAGWLYLAGVMVGLGMLCKPVLIAVPLCAAVAAWASPTVRRRLASWHTLAAGLLALAMQAPVVIWNYKHDWVTFRHMGGQAGIGQTNRHWFDGLVRMLSFIGGQAGGMGGIMFGLLVVAVVVVWQEAKSKKLEAGRPETARQVAARFLLSFTLPLWIFYLVLNLFAGTQINWPAASYFTGMVLLAGVAARYWNGAEPDIRLKDRRGWRRWVIGAVAWGVVLSTLAENTQWFYPLVRDKAVDASGKETRWHPHRWDLTYKQLRGWDEQAQVVQAVIDEMQKETGRTPRVAATRYDAASSLAFYLPGRPFVYCVMSYVGGRFSQYDEWADLNECYGWKSVGPAYVHAGEDVVLVGDIDDEALMKVIGPAFARVGQQEKLPVWYGGMTYREVVVRKCYGFKGLPETLRGAHF